MSNSLSRTGRDTSLTASIDSTRSRLFSAIEDRTDELIATVAELVREPSVLGNEAGVQQVVARHLAESGMRVESYDLPDDTPQQPNGGHSGVPFAGRPNVHGYRTGTGGGRSLILNGHVDVVSPEPVSAWTHDPWSAEIVGDRMYGRGAYDMKSGVGVNLFLSRLLNDLEIPLRGDLTIHSVIEEECTGNGALAASLRDTADACLIPESTNFRLTTAHTGTIWFRVRIEGRSAHAGWAWQGVNAIVKAVPVINALTQLNDELNLQVHPLWADQHHPINLNIGVIQGGDWPSTVPGACELRCRTSFFPGTTVEEMRAKIEGAVNAAAETDDWLREHRPVVIYDGFKTNGVIVNQDEPMVELIRSTYASVTGQQLEDKVGPAVTDQRYYNFRGIPSVCFGARGDLAHGADEWLDLTSLPTVAKVMGSFILEWCGIAG
jgi:acetylornithine deacetylase